MLSSRVNAVTVRMAPTDSVANLALSAKTFRFMVSNPFSTRMRKKPAARASGMADESATIVSFHPK